VRQKQRYNSWLKRRKKKASNRKRSLTATLQHSENSYMFLQMVEG